MLPTKISAATVRALVCASVLSLLSPADTGARRYPQVADNYDVQYLQGVAPAHQNRYFAPHCRQTVQNFFEVMSRHFDTDALANMQHNLQNLTIYLDYPYASLLQDKIDGLYRNDKNLILLRHFGASATDKKILYHELLHMASSAVKDDVYCCGFNQQKFVPAQKQWLFMGVGLNEGYTELLTTRYFGKNRYRAYQPLVNICAHLEQLLGQQAMQHFYLTADLNGLAAALQAYTPNNDFETVRKFIYDVDCVRFQELFVGTKVHAKKKIFAHEHQASLAVANFLAEAYGLKCAQNADTTPNVNSTKSARQLDKYLTQLAADMGTCLGTPLVTVDALRTRATAAVNTQNQFQALLEELQAF